MRWAGACLVWLAVLATRAYAQEKTEEKVDFNRIRVGMTEAQVKKVAGNPEIIERFKTLKIGSRDTCTYWRYEHDYTVIFKKHVVESIERDHTALLKQIQEWADPANKERIKLIYK